MQSMIGKWKESLGRLKNKTGYPFFCGIQTDGLISKKGELCWLKPNFAKASLGESGALGSGTFLILIVQKILNPKFFELLSREIDDNDYRSQP